MAKLWHMMGKKHTMKSSRGKTFKLRALSLLFNQSNLCCPFVLDSLTLCALYFSVSLYQNVYHIFLFSTVKHLGFILTESCS